MNKEKSKLTANKSQSDFFLGNRALQSGNYAEAIKYYEEVLKKYPELEKIIASNIALAKQKLSGKSIKIVAKDFSVMSEEGVQTSAVSIDIVVPVFNALDDVKRCFESLARHTDGFVVKVIVVNDGSGEETTQWLRRYCDENPSFTLIESASNSGYTHAVNVGLKASNAGFVITQNSDTIVTHGWLTGLVRCMESDPKLGIVGPLSNAASWQNVPLLRDEAGNFAVNELPVGMCADDMAYLVAKVSQRRYPRLPFVNGFCFMIRRAVIDAIGYMDEENFPVGYGEENDYCIRAMDAGFEFAIADDVYVFHAKSKSFGHERRKELSAQGTASIKRKHTPEKYSTLVEAVKQTELMDAVRANIQAALKDQQSSHAVDLMTMRILFLLPVKGGGGGAHSVVQEVTEMRRMGLHAQVGVRHEQLDGFHKMYADIPAAKGIFVSFDDMTLLQLAEDYDVVIGTIFSSMKLVNRIVKVHPHILPAYYVQDYEPLFFPEGSPQWQEARESYTLVPGALLFAKTRWIIDEVGRHHGVQVHKVQPSIDHEVYKPLPRTDDGRLHVTAMIRPQTPYRGAERTMRLFSRLHQQYGDRLAINIFGCEDSQPDFQKLPRDFPYINHGPLLRPQVAALLARSDLFIDLSDYQAFGRTALEAMACGCAAVVPQAGGAHEYAVHKENALVVETQDDTASYEAVSAVLGNPTELRRLRRAGLATAARYSVHAAAISECLCIEAQLRLRRGHIPKKVKPQLLLMPSLRNDGLPTGSGFVRAVLPYQSAPVLNQWRVRPTQTLPDPGSAQAILIQREAIGHDLKQLETWLPRWKSAGGKLIYEIDDDLLDAEGLKARHYKGSIADTVAKVRYLAAHADVVHVSTEPLAERLRPFNANIHVIPNALDADLWQLDRPRDHTRGPYRRQPNGPVRIGYIGTPTHDEDLELVADAMRAIEKKYGDAVEIEVIGAFQNRAPTFGKRVGLPKKSDYPNFVRWLLERVHWDIGFISLAENNFNESKSYLKFLEYAALDLSIIVSDVYEYKKIGRHNENCYFVRNEYNSWLEGVSNLIEDKELRLKLSENARRHVLSKHKLDCVQNNVVFKL